MKVNIWTIATDTDDGTSSDVYSTQAAAEAAARQWIEECWNRFFGEGREFPADHWAAYDKLSNSAGFMDTISMAKHDIDVPDPVPAPKVWAVIRNIEGEMFIDSFMTETDAMNRAWEYVGECLEGRTEFFGNFETFKDHCNDDLQTAWQTLHDISHDSLNVEPILWPNAAPVPAQKTYIHIGVTLEGGVVQSVFTNDVTDQISVYVIDYDTEGLSDGELVDVPQNDGTTTKANVRDFGLERWGTPEFWQALNDGLDAKEESESVGAA